MPTKSIDKNKRYRIPDNLSVKNVDGKFLVISINTAKWIVLENKGQLDYFDLLKSHTISESLDLFQGEISDAKFVIIQLEAKDFENTKVESCIKKDEFTLHLYLTNECNLRCPHCYMFSGIKNNKELSFNEISYIFEEYKKRGGKKVTLSGGEVTVRRDFPDILKRSHNIGLKTRVLTNGTLWSKASISQLAPYIDSVQISIDGYSEKSNSVVRGKGNFKRSLECIDNFMAFNSNVEVAITPFPGHDLAVSSLKYAHFAQELITKYPKIRIKFAEEIIPGREVNLSKADAVVYKKYIDDIYTEFYGYNTFNYSFVKAFRQNIIMDNCMYGALSISSVGDVYFCARISSLKTVINIRTHSFDEIFRLSKEAMTKSNINNLKPCNKCDLKYICGGGCRIDYFSTLTNAKDISELNVQDIEARKCTEEERLYFYRLMIKNNKMLFK